MLRGHRVVWTAGHFTDYLNAEVQIWLLALLGGIPRTAAPGCIAAESDSLRYRTPRVGDEREGCCLTVVNESFALSPSKSELIAIFDTKYSRTAVMGWGPRMRRDFDYFTPDDQYEAIVAKLVGNGTWWADIGCGRDIFPSNPELAKTLSERSGFLFGVDPDPNIRDNPFIREGFEGIVEDTTPTIVST